MRYWLFEEGDVLGPFTAGELFERPGFSEASLVCPEGYGSEDLHWKPAGKFSAFSNISSSHKRASGKNKIIKKGKDSAPAESGAVNEKELHDAIESTDLLLGAKAAGQKNRPPVFGAGVETDSISVEDYFREFYEAENKNLSSVLGMPHDEMEDSDRNLGRFLHKILDKNSKESTHPPITVEPKAEAEHQDEPVIKPAMILPAEEARLRPSVIIKADHEEQEDVVKEITEFFPDTLKNIEAAAAAYRKTVKKSEHSQSAADLITGEALAADEDAAEHVYLEKQEEIAEDEGGITRKLLSVFKKEKDQTEEAPAKKEKKSKKKRGKKNKKEEPAQPPAAEEKETPPAAEQEPAALTEPPKSDPDALPQSVVALAAAEPQPAVEPPAETPAPEPVAEEIVAPEAQQEEPGASEEQEPEPSPREEEDSAEKTAFRGTLVPVVEDLDAAPPEFEVSRTTVEAPLERPVISRRGKQMFTVFASVLVLTCFLSVIGLQIPKILDEKTHTAPNIPQEPAAAEAGIAAVEEEEEDFPPLFVGPLPADAPAPAQEPKAKPLAQQAVEITKEFKLPKSRSTVQEYLRGANASYFSQGYKEEWTADFLHNDIFIVKYRLLSPRKEPLVYIFEVSLQQKTVLSGLNNATLSLLEK